MVEKTNKQKKEELKAELGKILEVERQARETQREWKQAYRNIRDATIDINDAVNDGKTSPQEGVIEIKKIVADWKFDGDE